MPVYKQISSGTASVSMLADGSLPWSCTCPQGSTLEPTTDASTHGVPSSSQESSLVQQQQQQDQQDQHPQQQVFSSTCLLHSNNSLALLKEQLAKQKRRLETQQQLQKLQQQRRKDPFEPLRTLPSRTFDLYAGSQFRGIQRSENHRYDVMVDIKYVDLNESFLCGYLHIKGLTEEYPELTTYFEAEIIGPRHLFLTHKWDADELIDEEHWSLFKPFDCLVSSVFYGLDMHHHGEDEPEDVPRCPHHHHYDPQTYDHRNEDVVFMRWKEHFLVPDHRVQGISGASFAGFYYICYSKVTGEIDGYYYHHSSEKHQQLLLKHVDERSSASFEFR
ncbi:GID complex subunit 4, VID24 [Mortierella claussenii]|nr:GID complex subunit 4, VID24 [Mortierella claussenii]